MFTKHSTHIGQKRRNQSELHPSLKRPITSKMEKLPKQIFFVISVIQDKISIKKRQTSSECEQAYFWKIISVEITQSYLWESRKLLANQKQTGQLPWHGH